MHSQNVQAGRTLVKEERLLVLYLEIPAICGEVHLNDKAGDVFAVADSVKGGSQH